MNAVNEKISRWKKSVRYLFEGPLFHREQEKPWTIADFRRAATESIDAKFGEVAARNRAAQLGAAYLEQVAAGRMAVLKMLVQDFGVDAKKASNKIADFQAGEKTDLDIKAAALRDALKPRRQALLTRFTSLKDGVKFLVDMRQELLAFSKDDDSFKVLDRELADLFELWFDPGFLDIQRVTWSSSASLLEKLMMYEANHSIVSWQDLKNRLDGDRRCYTLFHPRLSQEPLAILHVALTKGIATNVQDLLDVETEPTDPELADTAVFYSVTSPLDGLRGISFGEFIIKQAVKELRSELPDLKTFVTLSPIPGFKKWLNNNLKPEDFSDLPFTGATLDNALKTLAAERHQAWAPALEKLLTKKCLEYLITKDKGRPINSVTRFHLRNGAYIHRINFMGDTSKNGMDSAAGMMVNYGYNLKQIEDNLVRLHQGKFSLSSSLVKLAKQSGLDIDHLEGV